MLEARREFTALAEAPNANIRSLCRRFGICAHIGYKILNRFRAEGDAGLHDKSRRPRSSPCQTPETTVQAVIAIHTEHPSWGGRRIASRLGAAGEKVVPAPSTITEILRRHGRAPRRNEEDALRWMSMLAHKKLDAEDVPEWAGVADLPLLLDRLRHGHPLERKRSIAVLAYRHGLSASFICKFLNLSPGAYRRSLDVFAQGGAASLFARRINRHRKFDDDDVKKALFSTLHQPPSNFRINRTSWTMHELSRVMKEAGQPVSEDVIRKIIKSAGYRWRKARIVLTSNDPEFSEKIARIQSILSRLGADEAFFSIDEYGPLAIKRHGGRSLVAPGEQRFVPQYQTSRGSLIVTAAIELSTNQVTHFYSPKKNTSEMIRMMQVLIEQYRDQRKLYLSWDAASWHLSTALFEAVQEHNSKVTTSGPVVETVPLPARAQFLNVIESIFSGLARAIIHNSSYQSITEAEAAIDGYFSERNAYFSQHPRRAGGKIWGKESGPAEFSEAANCKAPCLR